MAKAKEEFTLFWGGPFSQWCSSPFTIGAFVYGCAEQYMMAEKARLFGDDETLAAILSTEDPAVQKRLGRQVRDYSDAVWQRLQGNGRPFCWNVVYTGNMAKFSQNADLLEELLATRGTTIVEASPYDTLWGIGRGEHDREALDRRLWRGKNWLGEVLDAVRDELERRVGEVR